MSEITIKNLSVDLSGKTIIQDMSCSFPKGELVGLIGPNGAGKSTLLRSCLKLIPVKGEFWAEGRDILKTSASERANVISFLPQERELAWAMTVESIVRLGLLTSTSSHSKSFRSEAQIINEAIELLELEPLRNRQATSLSGGELARVLIARLLAQDTPIIFADEPLAGLDPQHQIKVMRIFKDLASRGKTIVTSIHDLGQAALWCDHLILIDKGNIYVQGKPSGVLTVENLREIYQIEADIRDIDGRFLIVPTDVVN